MATIQIRDIPEDAYEVIRRRARAEGRSIQSYMLQHVLAFTAEPSKSEMLAQWEQTMRGSESPGIDRESIIDAIDAGRREREW